MRDREGEMMLNIFTMIVWSMLGYLSGYSDACEENRQGLIKIVIYMLAAVGLVIIVSQTLKKGVLI